MSTNAAREKKLYIGNAHLVMQQLTYYVPGQADWERWNGLPLTVRISATSTGTAITGLGPFTMTFDADGNAVYTISSALINAALNNATYLDKLVYQIVEGGPSSEYSSVVPLRVTKPRYAT